MNMGMARMARAPVLLAGDIDRGGVFASLYGTVALLEAGERAMVKGTVINKFRGDAALLRPGLTMLEELTQIPVVGVVPWLELDLDDEDSLSPRLTSGRREALLDVAVVRLPHISNFTDFNALGRHPAVGLRYTDRPEDLGRPDLVILPGTKSTLADLDWLRRRGLDRAVLALAAAGTPVAGICGGYQMLGQRVDDPEGAEGGGSQEGLGLLPVATRFSREKTRTRRRAAFPACTGLFAPLEGCPLEGYEIHMGDSGPEGLFSVRENVLGTYLHGFFDTPELRDRLVSLLLARRGLTWTGETGDEDGQAYREEQYDKLAAALRASLDLEAVYRILEQGLD